jgi:hypothetical protein
MRHASTGEAAARSGYREVQALTGTTGFAPQPATAPESRPAGPKLASALVTAVATVGTFRCRAVGVGGTARLRGHLWKPRGQTPRPPAPADRGVARRPGPTWHAAVIRDLPRRSRGWILRSAGATARVDDSWTCGQAGRLRGG